MILRVYQQATRDGREAAPLKKRKRGEYRDIPVPTWLWDMVRELPGGPLTPGTVTGDTSCTGQFTTGS